jgi:hypothetical protein
MIFPVAVTLKRFLALEFVFTLGILPSIYITPLRHPTTGRAFIEPLQAMVSTFWQTVEELPFFQTDCKDKGETLSSKGF